MTVASLAMVVPACASNAIGHDVAVGMAVVVRVAVGMIVVVIMLVIVFMFVRRCAGNLRFTDRRLCCIAHVGSGLNNTGMAQSSCHILPHWLRRYIYPQTCRPSAGTRSQGPHHPTASPTGPKRRVFGDAARQAKRIQ